MGVFGNAPETERLHFHVLMYIPDGEMIESVYEKKDYDKKSEKMTDTRINTFFRGRVRKKGFPTHKGKGENMDEDAKHGKRRGRKSGLAFVPAARLRVKLLLIGYRRLKVGISLGFYSGVWYDGRLVDNKKWLNITNAADFCIFEAQFNGKALIFYKINK